MKRIFYFWTLTLVMLGLSCSLFAGGGMWLPHLIKQLNEAEMQSMGMKLSAEDIYNVNQSSLKDAIVSFGGFCTAEIISDKGLLLTNHHCGYGQIQSHTTLENNYLRDGFWAKTLQDEIPNSGLTATLIVRIEDVTKFVLAGVTDGMTPRERQSLIDKNLNGVKESFELLSHEEVSIRPFFHGNQYHAFVTVTYRDVRLVGTPPDAIGKFGADTDNWEWPRHTGDFALFRIYAGADNLPADYSPDNLPYKPKHFLPISLDGVEEGDFTLVFGFPGRTNQYLPSPAVKQIMEVTDPTLIAIRDRALSIIDAAMRRDPAIKIKYASKQASIANGWKKWIGEVQGLQRANAVGKKEVFEKQFLQALDKMPALSRKYGHLLQEFKELYHEIEPFEVARTYYNEIVGRHIELMRFALLNDRLVNAYQNNGEAGYDSFLERLQPFMKGLYGNYDMQVDKLLFASLMDYYFEQVDDKYLPADLKKKVKSTKEGFQTITNEVFSMSKFVSEESMNAIWDMKPAKAVEAIEKDPAYQWAKSLSNAFEERVNPSYSSIQESIDDMQRQYMAGMMEAFPNNRWFPDANSTLRVTYGQVAGYLPRDGVQYFPVSHLEGVMEKYKPGDYEFDVPERLRQLFAQKDYGQYAAANGQMPVCFLGSNHTTGGNSGSPAIDAHGNLIGLNFDRVWEGTMSDINYDADICRNIMVDARYILFIIDKYAGAGHLVDEMKLVHPKSK